MPEILGIVAKLQFDLAIDRLDGEPGAMQVGSVGFVDLTGSTKATERLGAGAMAPALTRFGGGPRSSPSVPAAGS